jgi:hypothetical protein
LEFAIESEIPASEDHPAAFPVKTIAMKRVPPAPEVPQLSGTLTKETTEVDGVTRTYRTYVPQGLAKGAALVVVMHGSGENGAQIRIETGYGFDRTADTQLWRIRDRRTFASPCPTR